LKFLRRKVIQPIIDLLKQGITPERIALTIALGVILGVTPVLGSSTLLCTIAAVSLRLNLPVIQLVNGMVYPLQLALIIPFLKIGAWLFRTEPPAVSLSYLVSLIRADAWHAIAMLWTALMHALVAWILMGALSAGGLYLLSLPLIRRLWVRVRVAPDAVV